MLEHQVLRTIAVGRHVLLIADVRAGPGLAGSSVADTEDDGQARVLALQAGGAAALDWSPHRGYLLAAGDQIIVLDRTGLGRSFRSLTRFCSAAQHISFAGQIVLIVEQYTLGVRCVKGRGRD